MSAPRTAATRADHADEQLRGRTYSIPFEDVWQGALRIVRERARGWKIDTADDQDGWIVAHIHTWPKQWNGSIRIHVTLDANAQTRVDASTIIPAAFHDFGANARRLRKFFRLLDQEAPREQQRRARMLAQR